jgi:photosystem II biogenesis protein Psp29
VKFGSVDKIRTVSDSKRDFYTRHTRPINSVYRRVVEELLVEMHLLSVNVDFHYDPIYALGVVTSFEKFMEGYRPEDDKPNIFAALCQAVNGNPEVYRRDAENLIAIAKETNIDSLVSSLQNPNTSNQNQLFDTLVSIVNAPKFKYSRLFAIGLYTILAEAQPAIIKEKEKREQIFQQFSEILHLSTEKLQKDLDVYRSNLDKMDQLLKVIEDALEAEKKKRQQKEQEKQTTLQ